MNATTRVASPAHRRAVVIGGGMAGMLAAHVLSSHADTVTVIERDTLPTEAMPRKGLPQARHVHVIWSAGVAAIESLLPGITDKWIEAGARRIGLPTDLVTMTARGWIPRYPEVRFNIAGARDLLDFTVRERVLRSSTISVLQRHELVGLEGSSEQVTGVRVQPLGDAAGEAYVIDADLVVDASGRGSKATRWLADLGVADIKEARVDSGLVYATRLYEAPAGSGLYPIVNVQSDPSQPVPGRTATIVPEGDLWRVTLSSTRGAVLNDDPAAFEPFAASLRHSIVGDLIAGLAPARDESGAEYPIAVTRSTVNRRIFFEKAPVPARFLVVGDAVATYNPLYGQGITVLAQGLVQLRDLLTSQGLSAGKLSRAAQRRIARSSAIAWQLATSQDILYPGAEASGVSQPPGAGALNAYVNQIILGATNNPKLAAAFLDVITLSHTPVAWLRPSTVFAVVRGALRGQGKGALTEPPLTEAELELVRKAKAMVRT